MVRHDYNCLKCDEVFEAWNDKPKCPECGSSKLEIIYITPPGIKSVRTKNADDIAKDLILGAGLGDYQSHPDRSSAAVKPKSDIRWRDTNARLELKDGKLIRKGEINIANVIGGMSKNLKGKAIPTTGNPLQEIPKLSLKRDTIIVAK